MAQRSNSEEAGSTKNCRTEQMSERLRECVASGPLTTRPVRADWDRAARDGHRSRGSSRGTAPPLPLAASAASVAVCRDVALSRSSLSGTAENKQRSHY